MTWKVEIIAVAVTELEALPVEFRARFERTVGLIRQFGLEQLREPYVKHLDGSLWEIRLKGKDGIARALYVTRAGRRMVVLRVFVKKTQRTPKREMRLARRRAAELE